MPPFRKSRKPSRRMKRKVFKKRSTVNINQALTPVPQRYITKMKYAESFQLNLANSYSYAWNLNSIFDPNRTGIGHQPYGHDQYALLYNRYRVIACSYTVQCFNGTNTVTLTATPSNDIVTFPNTDEAMENPRTRWIVQTAGGGAKVLKGNVSIPSLVGRNKQQYMADDRYQATFGTSPNEAAILNIGGSSISQVDVTMDCVITLNYVVEMFDVNKLSQS